MRRGQECDKGCHDKLFRGLRRMEGLTQGFIEGVSESV